MQTGRSGDVISDMAIDSVGMAVRAQFGDRPHKNGPVLCTFVQYLIIAFCSRPETASDVISAKFVGPIVHDKPVKFLDFPLNGSREIPTQAVGGVIFWYFATGSEVISSAVEDAAGVDALVQLILGQTVLEIYECLTL